MHIAITADHNGFALRTHLTAWLTERGHKVDGRGSDGSDEILDYPFLCAEIAREVLDGRADFGIVIGGSGQGEQIACNKIRGIRAGLCHCTFTSEIARAHNNANVLVIGAKVVSKELAEEITAVWLATEFKGGRHQIRLDQVAALERGDDLSSLA